MLPAGARGGGRGQLIALCGIDGAGKTTQVHRLAERLAGDGFSVAKTKVVFHAWSVVLGLGQRLGAEYANHLTVLGAAERESIVACDVARHADRIVRPLLESHDIVVWDRGPLCYAVNADAHGAYAPWIGALYASLPVPALSLLLDLPGAVGAGRVSRRTDKSPQPEENEDFLSTVREKYLRFAPHYPNVRIVDAGQPEDAVAETVHSMVLPMLRTPPTGTMVVSGPTR